MMAKVESEGNTDALVALDSSRAFFGIGAGLCQSPVYNQATPMDTTGDFPSAQRRENTQENTPDSLWQDQARTAETLLPLVYDELRRLAAHKLANERPGQTLQPTALVHEAWLRLVASDKQQFANRTHFFATAAEAMRRILIDQARRKQSLKRQCALASEPLDESRIE